MCAASRPNPTQTGRPLPLPPHLPTRARRRADRVGRVRAARRARARARGREPRGQTTALPGSSFRWVWFGVSLLLRRRLRCRERTRARRRGVASGVCLEQEPLETTRNNVANRTRSSARVGRGASSGALLLPSHHEEKRRSIGRVRSRGRARSVLARRGASSGALLLPSPRETSRRPVTVTCSRPRGRARPLPFPRESNGR